MGAGASAGNFEKCENFEHLIVSPQDLIPGPIKRKEASKPRTANSPSDANQKSVLGVLSLLIPAGPEGRPEERSTEAQEPPALLPHLRDLFMSRLHNPAITSMPVQEFWDLVESIFAHVFSDFDNSRLEIYLDVKSDKPVTWFEANEYLTVQVRLLKQRKKDLWIGLKTITGNERYFWHNIKDDTSMWMTESESSYYVSCLTMPIIERPRRFLLPSSVGFRKDTPHAAQLAGLTANVTSPRARGSPCRGMKSRGATRIFSH